MAEELQDFAEAFGDALLKFLQDNGLSQSDAAKRLGLNSRQILFVC